MTWKDAITKLYYYKSRESSSGRVKRRVKVYEVADQSTRQSTQYASHRLKGRSHSQGTVPAVFPRNDLQAAQRRTRQVLSRHSRTMFEGSSWGNRGQWICALLLPSSRSREISNTILFRGLLEDLQLPILTYSSTLWS